MKNKKHKEIEINNIDILRFFYSYIIKTPYFVTVAIICVILGSLADVFIPLFMGKMIDALAEGAGDINTQFNIALLALVGFIGFGVLHRIFFFISETIWMKTISEKMQQLTIDAYKRVSRFSTNWHMSSFSGSTVRKITRAKWAFDVLNEAIFTGLLPTLLVLIGITITQFIKWPTMGGIFIVAFSSYIVLSIILATKYAAPANKAFNKNDSKFGGALADAISCNEVVKAFGTEKREDRRLNSKLDKWCALLKKVWLRFIIVGTAQDLYLSFLIAIIIATALFQWKNGIYTTGEVTFVISSCMMIRGYVRNIGATIRVMQKSLNEMEDVVRFFKTPIEISDIADAKDIKVTKGNIVFDKVTFSYAGQDKEIYKDFSLTIKAKEKVALVGHSGSGKSTFVKLLQRLYDLDGGSIFIEGQNIADVTQSSLRQVLSIVPQDPLLFHRSIWENIAYGKEYASIDEVKRAAKLAYADGFIKNLPMGYESFVGERGVKLSGGERQRIAIARAILADKPILILDEATSSLDSESEMLIQKAIKKLTKNRTTIMIAHRLSTITQADRILVFDKGNIIEQGTHSELIKKKNGRYRKLLEIQSAGFVNNGLV